MRRLLITAALILLCVASLHCGGSGSNPTPMDPGAGGPTITSMVIPDTDLPVFDLSRTYKMPGGTGDPEDVLTALWNGGIEVTQGWQPLDNRCTPPLTPEFTVMLASADPAILGMGFEQGIGNLNCATMLLQYEVTD